MSFVSVRALAPIVAFTLLLAACASTSQQSTEAAEAIDTAPEEIVTTTTSITAEPSTSTTSSEAPVRDDAQSQSGEGSSTPPTTSTDGLASSAEAVSVPADLECRRIEDFNDDAQERWRVINDGVMGGLSEGFFSLTGSVATFSGTINTNGGGFSMIRTTTLRDGLGLVDGLDGAAYIQLRIRSANGRAYELTVQDSTTNTAVMHFTDVAVSDDGLWQEIVVPLSGLEARVFGAERPGLPEFDLEQISTLGIILADGLDGPFSLEIDRIDACSAS